ncbi:hypothetical protein SAMN02746065_10188 [Desulfocicer vacuolatum DSM 3385]|uniref:4Fe-4S Wbl-type domain-containing protein n=1 Tax=Desulfocicer vacuolatum DSM 3385 TaxID=1121400 RepID=A0A1W1YJ25_9BACT|nr:hypothetical protein [Desulfocicer vacuolatum]SMC36230.1 hypothetical protein SAMN02746065_10188 [Desulfocicer vacuolatum DSM 3385]
MADPGKRSLPQCFGQLEKVFPMGDRGLRQTPEVCMGCIHKTDCLRQAMSGTGGLNVKEEMVRRGEKAGAIGFLERWSKKKKLHRQKKKFGEKNEISKRS